MRTYTFCMQNKFSFLAFTVFFSITGVLAGGLDLEFYYGSRYIYLGGNQVAISRDAYAPFYNPAAMTAVDRPTIAINSTTLIDQFTAPIGAANQLRKSEVPINELF